MRRSITMCRVRIIAGTTIIIGGITAIAATGIKLNGNGRLAKRRPFYHAEGFCFPLARTKGILVARKFLNQGTSFT